MPESILERIEDKIAEGILEIWEFGEEGWCDDPEGHEENNDDEHKRRCHHHKKKREGTVTLVVTA